MVSSWSTNNFIKTALKDEEVGLRYPICHNLIILKSCLCISGFIKINYSPHV